MSKLFRRALIATAVALVPAASIVALTWPAHAAGGFPAQYAAPYLEIRSADAGDLATDMGATGLKYYTLAFLIPKSGCTPQWEFNNDPVGAFSSQISALKSAGGNVIISFGGASGGELAQTCTSSVANLTAAYRNVVDTYGVKRLDFDIEGAPLDDTTSISRRNQALAALQAADPSIEVDYTLPVDPGGLPGNAMNLLTDAKNKGVNVNLVNIMTMDFGASENVLADAESAANGTHTQLASIFPGLSSAQLWNKIGLTVIAGRNDDGSMFSQSDASTLESFAASRGVQELAFWEVDSYDKATGWAYSRIFNRITSNPVGDNFSVSVSPTSGAVTVGGSTTATVATAVTAGSAQSVSLSSSGAPAGVTVSFNPASVTAGGSSTLTVSSASSTAVGTYPITVTGTAASGTHATTYTLTVNPVSGGNAITNGGFETGDFTGWTRAGTTAIANSGHTGTHAVQLGSTSPTNGDSKVSQTFTAPGGASQLSFFYSITCPDDVAYDWATATLKDNTTGVTTTPLARTCTNGAGWKPVTAAVTAGHSYTVTLVSHDENNPGDATFTLYDDVTVNGSASGNDFAIATSPTSGSVATGGSTTATVSTSVVAGSAQSVSMSSSGAPAGVTVGFNPASVTAGGGSTLTVTAAASAVAGTYPITVIGTATSGSHTTLYTVTVTTPVSGGIVNGGFETGDFTGWTRSGTTSITTTGAHGGTHAVVLGSTGPTNGDSKVSQTFTAPSGTSRVSFFYNITCPDDVTYDWATATVKDNTTGATVTVLARTCTINQGWKQASTAVTPGHSYTVTLVSHDENNPGDATRTSYDDVIVS